MTRLLMVAGALLFFAAFEPVFDPAVAAAARGAHDAALTVRSDPAGASVYVDGRFVGQTPIDVTNLPTGDHRVRVVQDGYLENSRVVRLTDGRAETLEVRLTARAVTAAQAAGLKIVVIAGEDAVNIIQQKTAVNPIVEVRDRNDLPVAGVPVTFTIGGSGATFGSGLQTMTVSTNAAGRAAVTSLTPVSPGPLQINVTASAQGQTAAITITQTNVITAAAAAAAGGAAAAGAGAAAGGGGGGLSGGAIAAIVGGAGAAGIVGAKAAGLLGGGGGGGSNGDNGGSAACVWVVAPTSISVPSDPAEAFFDIRTTAPDCRPNNWTATSNAPFITFNGSSSVSGTGDARITGSLPAMTAGDSPRTGTITVVGQTVTVTQRARCLFTVSPTSLSFPAAGGTAVVTITMTPAVCDSPTWNANAGPSTFVTFSPVSGTGSGTVTVIVAPNRTSQAGLGAVLSIAGQLIQLVQAGSNTAATAPGRLDDRRAESFATPSRIDPLHDGIRK